MVKNSDMFVGGYQCVFIISTYRAPPHPNILLMYGYYKHLLSYDVVSGSVITPCNKIDNSQVVYRFTGNVMTSVTTFRNIMTKY